MENTRKRYSADFNAKVAWEALKGALTLAQMAAKHGVRSRALPNRSATTMPIGPTRPLAKSPPMRHMFEEAFNLIQC